MTSHVPRLPFALDPLIAEAKRRARQRRVLLVVAVILVAGGTAGGLLASRSSYPATRPIQAALVRIPIVGVDPGCCRFAPGTTFALSFVVANKAGGPVTLESMRAVLARHSPQRQIGTHLFAFKLPVCPGKCAPFNPIGAPPYGAERPVPLAVAPGHYALVRTDFEFAPCWNKTLSAGAIFRRLGVPAGGGIPLFRQVTVAYRIPDGATVHERLRLGNSLPLLTRYPARPTCRS
jgi:hypothetical protein